MCENRARGEENPKKAHAEPAVCETPLIWRLPVWVLLSILFTTAMISSSNRSGRLLTAPTYDDVTYLIDAARRIRVLDSSDVLGTIRHWVGNPPHSPGETFLAVLGFSVFGIHDWAAYAANSLIVLGLLCGVDVLTRRLCLIERLCIAGFVLSVPLAGVCVTEFRPDCAAGLATAMAILLSLRPSALSTLRQQICVGLLWASALLMKPSVSPLTVGLAGMTLGCHVGIHWLGEGIALREAVHWRRWFPVVATTLGAAVPHYLVASKHIFSYIHVNTIGAHREVWCFSGDWVDQLLYFWNGLGGEFMLGKHRWVLMLLVAIGAISILLQGNRLKTIRMLAMMLVAFAAYLVPSINPVKNFFFAASFDFLLVLGSAMVLGMMFRASSFGTWGIPAVRIVAFSFIATAALLARWPEGVLGRGTTQGTESIVVLRKVQQQMDQSIRQHRREDSPTVFSTTGGYTDAGPVEFMSLARGEDLVSQVAYTDADLSVYLRAMQKASFIIASEPGTGFVHEWLPSAKLQEQTLALAREMTELSCNAMIPALHGKRFYVFGRKDPFFGFDSVEGLDALEGPYSHLPLPRVRWGLWPSTRLKVTCGLAEQRKLELSMWTNLEGQEISVFVNGAEAHKIHLTPNNDHTLTRVSVPLVLASGENRIDLNYKHHHGESGSSRPMSVLFARLALEP